MTLSLGAEASGWNAEQGGQDSELRLSVFVAVKKSVF